MATSIQLPKELEQRVRASAERAGLEIDQYIIEILEQSTAPLLEETKETVEARLLEKINTSVPSATRKRFDYLRYLRDERRIDPEELAELIRITDEIEAADVERLRHLVDLAKLRNTSLEELIDSLGIKTGMDV